MSIVFAEAVLPGHPDKLCDRIADAIVDAAIARDPDALVGVEVAIHCDKVFVTGRVAASPEALAEVDVPALARRVLADSGYGERYAPDPAALDVRSVVCLEPLSPEERAIRTLSDDQSIVIGHASGDARTGFLPVEQHVARTIARALDDVRRDRPDLLGPDGKVLVALERFSECFEEDSLEAARLRSVSLSVHHADAADPIEVQRAGRAALALALRRLAPTQPDLARELPASAVLVNGAGAFSVGGPMGDNGLSGKKLVADAYGPSVPIGGGALSGKDPHKVDRLGALLARRLAVTIAHPRPLDEVTVRLTYVPGGERPTHVEVERAGPGTRRSSRRADRSRLDAIDLSSASTFDALGLARTRFEPLAAWGHFGSMHLPWERPARPRLRCRACRGADAGGAFPRTTPGSPSRAS